ncbi:MAG: Uma2 family endonuclease [Anaerolineae bacterium]|nr:Uma2 family endonuclease [Anaerolineae bacterium]
MSIKLSLKPTPAASEAEPKLITGEQLADMEDVHRSELVKGELVRVSPAGHPHGFFESSFAISLGIFVRQYKLGRVLTGEVGIYTGRNPDTIRAADVAFISNERLSQVQSQSYLDVAPELVIEILSPDDRWMTVNQKIDEYFTAGVVQIWIADPKRQHVDVYYSPTDFKRFSTGDTLPGGDILPGFTVAVAELFEAE